MNRWINNTRLIILAIALCAVAFTVWYDARYVWPIQKCERGQAWWDPKDRQCLDPIPIWKITGRALPAPPVSSPATSAPVSAGTPAAQR